MKKTDQITIRITPTLRAALEELAKEKDWTVSHLANRLLEAKIEELQKKEGSVNE